MRNVLKTAISLVNTGLSLILILPIRAYQLAISPMIGPVCKFYPSCSHYAIGSLRTHGPFKGLLLGSWRICRCHPWQSGGLDPVPDKGQWHPSIYPDGTPRATTITPVGV